MGIALNSEQQAAVNAGRGAWKVEAGAGSGKTRVIVERYQRLIRNGVLPEDVLCLTFTRSAAQEMAERAGAGKLRRGGFMTFHAFAFKFLLQNSRLLPFPLNRKVVASGGKVVAFLKDAVRGTRVEYQGARAAISKWKREGYFPEQVNADSIDGEELAGVYRRYEGRLRDEGLLDFEGLQLWTVSLLGKFDDVRDRYQFDWLMVDESQDCEPMQWRMMQLISQKTKNVFVVGDFNQALYEFRGAAPDNLLHFETWFSGARSLHLSTNYRSTGAIVDFCREIAPVHTGLVDKMRSVFGAGESPRLFFGEHPGHEAELVLDRTAAPDKTAVLCRTNAQLREFEDCCIARGVRYRLLGKSGFWQRREVQQVLAFVRVAVNPADDDAVEEIILSPFPCAKYLGKKFAERLRAGRGNLIQAMLNPPAGVKQHEARRAHSLAMLLRCIHEGCKGLPCAEALRYICDAAGIVQYHLSAGSEDSEEDCDNYALENVEQLLSSAERFASLEDLLRHAERAARDARESRGLTLSTVHQAKGREWDTVFVAGVTADFLPHKKGNEPEEARIFYVACSRAARKLYVSYSGEPSKFITGSSLSEQIEEAQRLVAGKATVPAGVPESLFSGVGQ